MKNPGKKKIEIEPMRHENHEDPIPPEFIPAPNEEAPFSLQPEIAPMSNPEIVPIKEG